MADAADAYSLPKSLEPSLARVQAYWEGLRRGDNDIPFWDDVRLNELGSSADDAVLVEVFENPLRFRLDIVGDNVAARYGEAINGKFVDELEQRTPLRDFAAQCRHTVESRRPTYHSALSSKTRKRQGESAGARLVLPLWGNGRIEMLLAVIVDAQRS